MSDIRITIHNAAEVLVYDDTRFSRFTKWLTDKNKYLKLSPKNTAFFFYFFFGLVAIAFYRDGIFSPQLKENEKFKDFIFFFGEDGLFFLTDWYRLFILLFIPIVMSWHNRVYQQLPKVLQNLFNKIPEETKGLVVQACKNSQDNQKRRQFVFLILALVPTASFLLISFWKTDGHSEGFATLSFISASYFMVSIYNAFVIGAVVFSLSQFAWTASELSEILKYCKKEDSSDKQSFDQLSEVISPFKTVGIVFWISLFIIALRNFAGIAMKDIDNCWQAFFTQTYVVPILIYLVVGTAYLIFHGYFESKISVLFEDKSSLRNLVSKILVIILVGSISGLLFFLYLKGVKTDNLVGFIAVLAGGLVTILCFIIGRMSSKRNE